MEPARRLSASSTSSGAWDRMKQTSTNTFSIWVTSFTGLRSHNADPYAADGNGWSGRFHRLLMSNSAVLKSTVRT